MCCGFFMENLPCNYVTLNLDITAIINEITILNILYFLHEL